MRVQKESKMTWVVAGIALFVIFSLMCFNDGMNQCGDMMFLHNRAVQMRDCLVNGRYPFFYYEDVGGIGYGTPIFYGQLTLFPFLPFVDDISTFLRLYFLAVLMVNFFGFRCFLKRVSDHATLASCFYITGLPFIAIYIGNLPANAMAVGWGWFFFAFCIDYFRDKRSLALLILSYFMIWQSNLNSAVLSVVVCFGIFCVYFKKERMRDYIKLFLFMAVLLSYNLVNMLIHIDSIAVVTADYMMDVFAEGTDFRTMSILPVGGYIVRNQFDLDKCCGFMVLPVVLLFLWFITRGMRSQSKRFKVCSAFIIEFAVLGYVVGAYPIWLEVYKATDIFFQFPIRYYIYLFGFVIAVLSRFVRPHWAVYLVLFFCVFDLFLTNPMKSATLDDKYYIGIQLANGEYASDKFLKDIDVYNQYGKNVNAESGAEYSFEKEFGVVRVDCSANAGEDVLTLPRMYYKGYQATGSDRERFEVRSGYSNYCEVDIGSYQGELTLEYRVPAVVIVLFVVQIASISYWSGVAVAGILSDCKRLKKEVSDESSERA